MSKGYEDLVLTCARCRAEFVWTAGEQAYYAERELRQPRFCEVCRKERRAENHGKIWGSRVAQYDTETRRVLCSFCSSPASCEASRLKGRAVCAKCAGVAEGDDIMTIEQWARPLEARLDT